MFAEKGRVVSGSQAHFWHGSMPFLNTGIVVSQYPSHFCLFRKDTRE